MAMNDIIGKAVVLTGNDEIGYGSEGDTIFGVVTKVEKAGNLTAYPLNYQGATGSATFKIDSSTQGVLDSSATDTYVATVEFNKMFEKIPITSTAAKKPSAGNIVVADGSGGLVKLASLAVADSAVSVVGLNAIATSVNTTDNTATIKVL